MQRKLSLITLILGLSLSSCLVVAQESAIYKMQYKHLMDPSENAVQRESHNQSVYIYEGMKLADVEQAMDTQFDRVENMMFVMTRVPTSDGAEHQTEADGCD